MDQGCNPQELVRPRIVRGMLPSYLGTMPDTTKG